LQEAEETPRLAVGEIGNVGNPDVPFPCDPVRNYVLKGDSLAGEGRLHVLPDHLVRFLAQNLSLMLSVERCGGLPEPILEMPGAVSIPLP